MVVVVCLLAWCVQSAGGVEGEVGGGPLSCGVGFRPGDCWPGWGLGCVSLFLVVGWLGWVCSLGCLLGGLVGLGVDDWGLVVWGLVVWVG